MSGGTVEIWTDGACLGNPGPGGWAAILRLGSREREVSGGEPDTTNNRMELMAAISALEALTRPSKVRLVSDSEYVLKGISEWLPGWRARGWKKVKNRDLWERLDEAAARHDVAWEWVRGHSGDEMNERVDKLAVAEAERQKAGGGARPSRAEAPSPRVEAAHAVVRVAPGEGDLEARVSVVRVLRSAARAADEAARLRAEDPGAAYFVSPTEVAGG